MINQRWNQFQAENKYADVIYTSQRITITTKKDNQYVYHKLSPKSGHWDVAFNGVRIMDPNDPNEPLKYKIEKLDDILLDLFNTEDPPITVVID
jgi:hypothetical protein